MSKSAIGVTLLLLILTGLFVYKWGGSIRTLQAVQATSQLNKSADPLMNVPPLQATWNYFLIVWPALVYGILIGAVLRSSISPRRVASLLGGDGVASTVAGSIAGAPLMLCSCCITPVFSGAYERGARLGPALALMLSSPGLNVAALALTFMLLPLPISLARVAASVVIVLGLSTLIGRTLGGTVAKSGLCVISDEADTPPGGYLMHFLKNLWYMTRVTVPLIVLGVLVSSLILPVTLQMTSMGQILLVLTIAVVAVPLALPTFFEIPLALFLTPYSPGAAVALLVAGPIINLPSLLVLSGETSPRVAISLALGVAVVAAAAGLAVSF
jgi:uncharacterized membrane protein YraQ (UPF0718 family)